MKSFCYSHTGSRANNEDYKGSSDFIFVLCDGVGGLHNGEIASKMVCTSIIEKTALYKQNEITSGLIKNLVNEVQSELNQKAQEQHELMGIGTTFCAVVFTDKELICAHIGDSRIYVIDTITSNYWRTTDHSVSGELIKSGIIKNSKSRKHPMANQLTRAIQANPENALAETEIQLFKNIDSRYLIFLCTDGVNEVLQDEDLIEILCNKSISINERFDKIKEACINKAKDNNSAILIHPETDIKNEGTSKSNEKLWIHLRKNESSLVKSFFEKWMRIFTIKFYLTQNHSITFINN